MTKAINRFEESCFTTPGLPKQFAGIELGQVYAMSLGSVHWLDYVLEQIQSEQIKVVSFRDFADFIPQTLDNAQVKNVELLSIAQKSVLKINNKAPRLLVELKHLQAKNGVVVLDISTQLVDTTTAQQIALLSNFKSFAQAQNTAVFLVFSQENFEVSEYLRKYQSEFYGVMKLMGGAFPTSLTFSHWFTDDGVHFEHKLPIKLLNGSLSVAQQFEQPTFIVNSDELVVLVDEHHKRLVGNLNNTWKLASSAQELDDLIATNPTATVLCHATLAESLKDFAMRIYRWRQIAGEDLKIVILEADLHLRLSEQKILKSLGANIVLPKNLNLTILNNIVTSIQNLRFYGDLTAEFSQIFNEQAIPTQIGYLEPHDYLDAVHTLVNTSGQYGIEGVLIYLEVPTGIPVLETIRHSTFNRHGDLFSIIDNQVIIYLYGCRAENVDRTLAAVLGAEPLLIFKSVSKFSNLDGIQIQVLQLQEYIENISVADYSEDIARFTKDKANKQNESVASADKLKRNIAKPYELKLH